MRRGLPDRRGRLCAAAGRHADAKAAHAARRPTATPAARSPCCCIHDEAHGAPLIDALARFGDGLPANVLPVAVNEVTQVGLEAIAAAFAYGACAVRFLLRAKPRHDVSGLAKTLALAEPILAGLGFGAGRVATIETDDPDALGAALRAIDDGRRRAAARQASPPSAPSAKSCGLRCASCSARRRRRST